MSNPTVPIWIYRFRRVAGNFIFAFNDLNGLAQEALATGRMVIDEAGEMTTTLTQEDMPEGVMLEDLVAAFAVLVRVSNDIPNPDSSHVYQVMEPSSIRA